MTNLAVFTFGIRQALSAIQITIIKAISLVSCLGAQILYN